MDEELTDEERLKRASFQGNVNIGFPELEDEELERKFANHLMTQFRARIAAEDAAEAEAEPGDDTETSAPATGN